jgi:hypothetical protein
MAKERDKELKKSIWFFLFAAYGNAVVQAVSRWISTQAARVRVRAASGVCGGQGGTGAGFLRVLQFPLPIIKVTRGWHNRPVSGRSAEWTQLDSTPLPSLYLK